MTYSQVTNAADKTLDLALEALNNGQLSEYVSLNKHVDYLNGLARALEGNKIKRSEIQGMMDSIANELKTKIKH
tara:strand:- start:149 stop:370 length:222 start_codon:yes stop_codon:yes gene_type:complete